MAHTLSRMDSQTIRPIDQTEETWLEGLEEEVNSELQGFNGSILAIGSTLRNRKPHEADLFADMHVLGEHAKKIDRLRTRIQDALEANKREHQDSPLIRQWKLYRMEYATDGIAIALMIINNVMKTLDLSAASNLGWSALALQGVSQIFSKVGDRVNIGKLSQEQVRTKLRELRSRLSVVDRARTMIRLFRLFEKIRKGEKSGEVKLVSRAVALCQDIPEEFQEHVKPNELAMQILAVSGTDLEKAKDNTALKNAVFRVLAATPPATNKLSDGDTSLKLEQMEIQSVQDLLKYWNRASSQVETALTSVDNILVSRMEDTGELRFGVIIEILGKQAKILRELLGHAERFTALHQAAYCSPEMRLRIASTIETCITAGTGLSFALFNLSNTSNVTTLWLSGLATMAGPVLSKVNKLAMKQAITNEVDRQLLGKIKEGRSFVGSIEAMATMLRSIEESQAQFTTQQITEMLFSCKKADPFQGMPSIVDTSEHLTQVDMERNMGLKESVETVEDRLRRMRKAQKLENRRKVPQKPCCTISCSCCFPSMQKCETSLGPVRYDDIEEGGGDISDLELDDKKEGAPETEGDEPPRLMRGLSAPSSQEDLFSLFIQQVGEVANKDSPLTPSTLGPNNLQRFSIERRDDYYSLV